MAQTELVPGRCPICKGPTTIRYRGYPGYQRPSTFDILSCSSCGLSYATPLIADDHLYDLIYHHRWELPGYCEYAIRAEEILRARDPLNYLTETAFEFWGIASTIGQLAPDQTASILEVGSGIGYLTYALARHGYSISGIDVSPKAVELATARYGNHFICDEVSHFSRKTPECYEIVLASEVLEHVQDIWTFMTSIRALLKTGGKFVMTTPNRSAFPMEALWQTEAPPVHLWWFSEASIRALAHSNGFSIEQVDLRKCKNVIYPPVVPVRDWSKPTSQPFFEKEEICFSGHRQIAFRIKLNYYLRWFGLLKVARLAKTSLRRSLGSLRVTTNHPHRSKPVIMCTIMTKL